MLFANDIVLVVETKEEVNNKLEEWRTILEGGGLRISRTMTEYLQCDLSETLPIEELEVSIYEKVVSCTTKFKYLGLIIQSNREIDREVTHRIQVKFQSR